MQPGDVQNNMSKTQLVQRMQDILQNAVRDQQQIYAQESARRSEQAQTNVEDTRQKENVTIRQEEGRGQPFARRRGHRKRRDQDSEDPSRPPSDPRGRGHIIDRTV